MSEPIITITESAAERIKEILKNSKDDNVKGVRVSVTKGGCAGMSYEMNYIKEKILGDEIIKDRGVEVYVDPKAIMYLLGTIMDYKKEKFSSTFVFNNPNETERCGCGESFKI